MIQTSQRMCAAQGPSSLRFNLHTTHITHNKHSSTDCRGNTGTTSLYGLHPYMKSKRAHLHLEHSPGGVRGSDEEIDHHPVTHVEALLDNPAGPQKHFFLTFYIIDFSHQSSLRPLATWGHE